MENKEPFDPLDYNYYGSVLKDRLEFRIDTVYLKLSNLLLRRKQLIPQRSLEICINELFPELSKRPQINAYAIYGQDVDRICIMRFLLRFFGCVFSDVEKDQKRYTWMFYVALFFCAFHEFAHLYLGHCQLAKTKKLSMAFTKFNQEISPLDLQAMELQADTIAVQEVAAILTESIGNGTYRKEFKYDDEDLFYYDALRGICGFFSIIKYLQLKEEIRRQNRGYEGLYDHPSVILRSYYAGNCFLTAMKHRGFRSMEREFHDLLVNTDTIFMREAPDEERKQYEYRAVLDGSIKEMVSQVTVYTISVLDPKLKPYTRIRMKKKVCL